ncbi:MAG: hypothetical protein U9O59_07880, partial [Actinomycetota bacterium]|nr:hypothetical protein [Actinomycetota bacterium]
MIFGSGDPTAIAIPFRQLMVDLIKDFELPFWNKFNFSGYPLLSYIETSVFYPITFILNLI